MPLILSTSTDRRRWNHEKKPSDTERPDRFDRYFLGLAGSALKLLFVLIFTLAVSCTEKKSTTDTTDQLEKNPPEGIAKKLTKFSYSEPHLGTIARLVFYATDQQHADKLAKQCFARINELNAKLSDYLPDSEVRQLSEKPLGQPHRVSPELLTIATFARDLSEKTDGAFDITIGKHTQRWRKNSGQSQGEDNDTTTSFRDLLIDSRAGTITLTKPLRIDLGAIGKGYVADQLMAILKAGGIRHAAVVIGGETVLADPPPGKDGWRIGIESPERKIIGKLTLSNTAISTSGDSYQFFEVDGQRRSHLIDPSSKRSKTNRLNVTTLAPSAMQADAWATALRILPIRKALALANSQAQLEALFIPHQKPTEQTESFPALQVGSSQKSP